MSFQGSRHDHPVVVVHPLDGQPIPLGGLSERDNQPGIEAFSYTHRIGMPGPFVQMTVKDPYARPGQAPLDDRIQGSDWWDVSCRTSRGDDVLCRGQIETVRLEHTHTEKGNDNVSYELSGYGFGHIYQKTPLWFDRITSDRLQSAVTAQVLEFAMVLDNPPNIAVQTILQGFFGAVTTSPQGFGEGQPRWELPRSLAGAGVYFGDVARFQFEEMRNQRPARGALIDPHTWWPNGTVWSAAQDYSDPFFSELYTEMGVETSPGVWEVPQPDASGYAAPVPSHQAGMVTVFRNRPWPTSIYGSTAVTTPLSISGHPWWTRPAFIVRDEDIERMDLSRSNENRYNAFFVEPRLQQQQANAHVDLQTPLADWDSIKRHGFRRADIKSEYRGITEDGQGLFQMSRDMRQMFADHWLLGHKYLTGSLQLRTPRPDIRLGSKVVVKRASPHGLPLELYIEGVAHNWSAPQGWRTTLTVTRGWRGTPIDQLLELEAVSRRVRNTLAVQEATNGGV